ncbi:DeoR/GlpR family DNA-binding transcription regulator [Amycolatopsis sp. NPDC051903]|uniref:DeoR/GlpR family DNA-binding transcription regulator n=1 Tax=Amycolatopsis sp. NPDC051903 TaxID=3363936 RepID=UPI0037988E8A
MSSDKSPAHSRESRQQMLVDYVFNTGSATIGDLVDLTGVSNMTVHRDIDELVRRGLLRKYRGGVSAMPSTVFESNAEYRMNAHAGAKRLIAMNAVEHVEPGMSVLLDDSTTALALAKLLPPMAPLTVATNYLGAIDVLKDVEDLRLICIGGDYSPTHDSFLGMQCLEAIERLSVDIAFVSTSAMNTEMTYHQEPEIVMVKRAMLASARRKVLLMDASKMERTALHRLAPLGDFDLLIVDEEIDAHLADELRSRVELEISEDID